MSPWPVVAVAVGFLGLAAYSVLDDGDGDAGAAQSQRSGGAPGSDVPPGYELLESKVEPPTPEIHLAFLRAMAETGQAQIELPFLGVVTIEGEVNDPFQREPNEGVPLRHGGIVGIVAGQPGTDVYFWIDGNGVSGWIDRLPDPERYGTTVLEFQVNLDEPEPYRTEQRYELWRRPLTG